MPVSGVGSASFSGLSRVEQRKNEASLVFLATEIKGASQSSKQLVLELKSPDLPESRKTELVRDARRLFNQLSSDATEITACKKKMAISSLKSSLVGTCNLAIAEAKRATNDLSAARADCEVRFSPGPNRIVETSVHFASGTKLHDGGPKHQ
jgi:hypothetical protein